MASETQSWMQSRSDHVDYQVVLDDMLKCLIRNWWKFIAVITIICSIAYMGAKAVYKPSYTATSTFIVNSINTAGHERNQYNSTVTSQLGIVFPYLLTSDLMTKMVAEDLGTESVPGRISAEALSGTNLITLKAEAGEAQLAYDILQSVIRNYPEVSSFVIGDVELKLMDESGVPKNPTNAQKHWKYTAMSGAAAIVLCIIFLFLYAVTRMTVRSEKDLKVLFNIPALGTVPRIKFKKRSENKEQRVAVDGENIPYFFIESFRTIRNRVEKEATEQQLKTFIVTSALPSEGKSTVAVNLALSLAHKDRRVILVDGDLRNPSVAKLLNISDVEKGVHDVLCGDAALTDVLVTYEKNSNLQVLPGHDSLSNPTEILNSLAAQSMIRVLKRLTDFVIIDTPPSALVSDASIIAKHADGCLFVVRQDYAKVDSLQEGMEMLVGTGVHLVGTVLNGAESSVFSGGYGYGYYQYGRYGHYGRYGYSRKYGYEGYYGKGHGYGYYGYGEKKVKEKDIDNKEQHIERTDADSIVSDLEVTDSDKQSNISTEADVDSIVLDMEEPATDE